MKLPPPHGTPARARRHYRDGTPLCEPCRIAVRYDRADRRAEEARRHANASRQAGHDSQARARARQADPPPPIDWDAAITRLRQHLEGTR